MPVECTNTEWKVTTYHAKHYIENYRAELAENIDEKRSINVPLIISLYNTWNDTRKPPGEY